MKKMHKPLSLVLALMMCLCLAGCDGETENDTPDTPSSPVSTPNDSTTNNNVSTPEDSSNTSDPAQIALEPIEMTVTDITLDPEAGYGFHHRSVYGNAFGLIYSYGSVRGRSIDNATIMVVPIEMNNLDDILATEWCANIKKEELTEIDLDGKTAWMSTEAAAAELAASLAEYTYDGLFVELKLSELVSSGLSQDEAMPQIMNMLANVGLGDVG